MYNDHYTAIKTRLDNQVAALKDIQWFNDQYSSEIITSCLALIEFPGPVPVNYISKQSRRSAYQVCIHVLSKILSDKDGFVPDAQLATHDGVADSVEAALSEYQLTSGGSNLGRPLIVTGFETRLADT